MIDFEFFDKYLASKDKGFIDYTDKITVEAINYFRTKKVSEWRSLFKQTPKTKIINLFKVEIICSKCKKIEEVEMTKTKLFNYISDCSYKCKECEEVEKKERQKETSEFDRNKYTDKYISMFLDPSKVWNDGIKLYEKMNYIRDYRILDDIVSEYINSMEYYDFLKTPYWKAIAEKVKAKANYKCELCYSSINLVTHHKTYKRHGYEHLYWKEDLICLCNECHEKFHFE